MSTHHSAFFVRVLPPALRVQGCVAVAEGHGDPQTLNRSEVLVGRIVNATCEIKLKTDLFNYIDVWKQKPSESHFNSLRLWKIKN